MLSWNNSRIMEKCFYCLDKYTLSINEKMNAWTTKVLVLVTFNLNIDFFPSLGVIQTSDGNVFVLYLT